MISSSGGCKSTAGPFPPNAPSSRDSLKKATPGAFSRQSGRDYRGVDLFLILILSNERDLQIGITVSQNDSRLIIRLNDQWRNREPGALQSYDNRGGSVAGNF